MLGYDRRAVALSVAIGLTALLIPASAGAATTIGSDLAATPTASTSCNPGPTFLQQSLAGSELTAPSDGVVVRYRLRIDTGTPNVKLRVIRAAAGDTYTGINSSDLVQAAPGVNTFETRLEIQAGDYIGIDVAAGNTLKAFATNPNALRRSFQPALADGETRAPGECFDGRNYEILMNADIELDCDGDGLGDETQDPDISACKDRTLTLDANKAKVKKGKKVLLSGQVVDAPLNAAGCAANQTVELQRKRPTQTSFTTFDQVQTDAQGNFSTKEKVKKTFEYRAQIAESGNCTAEFSSTQKVTIKKKT